MKKQNLVQETNNVEGSTSNNAENMSREVISIPKTELYQEASSSIVEQENVKPNSAMQTTNFKEPQPIEIYPERKIVNDDANLSGDAWWPKTSDVEEGSSSESQWPTNPLIQVNMPISTSYSHIESPKVQSRKGSLSVIDTIKEMTMMKIKDPEDEPDFLQRNPTWEDSLDPININETIKKKKKIKQEQLQRAFEAMANADGGVFISAHHTIAQKQWKNAYLTLKRLLALRKLERTSRVGPGAELDGYSFGIFSPKHPMRKFLFKCIFCQNAEYFLLLIITTHLIVLIEKSTANLSSNVKDNLVTIDIVITALYTIECALRIFTLGFIKGPHSYLRSTYNKIDFLIVIDSWVHIYMATQNKDGFFRFATLRAFRALLVLRHYAFFANVIAIMDACQGSLAPLGNVLIFIAMIFSFYALVGVHFFGGKLKNRCTRKLDGQLPYIQEFCGPTGSTCDSNTTIVSYMSTFCVKGLVCQGNLTIPYGSPGLQVCNASYGNPNWGISNYDGFPQAILILFQIMTFEGWALQMYSMSDSVGLNSDVYYIVMVIIGSYFAVNVCVAAISGVFIRVRHEHQVLLKKHKREQAFTFHNTIKLANVLKDIIKKDDAKLSWFGRVRKKTGMLNRNVSTFIRQGTKRFSSMSFKGQSFLKRQFSRGASFGAHNFDAEVDDDENEYGSFKRTRSLKKNSSFSRSLSRSLSNNTKSFNRSISKNTRLTAHHLNYALVGLVKSRFFRHMELLLITINFIILCCNTASMSDKTEKTIYDASIAIQIAFVVEMSLRALAMGFRQYLHDVMNILDIIVVTVSFLGVTSQRWANISSIRLLRFFHDPKKQKFGKSDETPSPLALCLKSFNILGSLAFFYIIVTMVFGIIAMELYSQEFDTFPEGLPRENYNSFFSAAITWFTISTGESWINQLWNAMHPQVRYRWVSPYLFVIYFLITTYILINLIIAVILEQTELTDNQKKQIQKREYLKYLHASHSSAKSLRTGDWVIDAVESTQARVDKFKKKFSVMVPVSKNVKRVNIPSEVHEKIEEIGNQNKNDTSKKTYSVGSKQHEGQGFRPARISRPRSSDILQSILEMPEKKKKTSFQESPRITDNNSPLRRERSSLDPVLLSHARTGIASLDASSKDAIRRESSYNPVSTPFDIGYGPYSNRPRRPSKNATKVFVSAGFANTTTYQDFLEEKTALQSAMLTLAHNLSSPVGTKEEFASIHDLQESEANSSHLHPINEDTTKKYDDQKIETPISKQQQDLFHSLSMRGSSKRISFKLEDYEGLNIKYRDVPWYFSNESLFIFKSGGPTRRFLVFVVENIWYKRFIMACAIIAVFIVTQLNPAGFIDNVHIDLMDRFLLFTWTLDVAIKSIAYGLIFTPEAYLGDPFNIIDVVNMFFQWVGFNPPSEAYSRIVHIMNTIRGTRFIPRIQGLRILVSTMLHTIPAVASMFGFILVIYFIFATIGIQMFKNRFASCTDRSVSDRAECVGTFVNEIGLRSQRVWMNPPLHFDYFGAAMLSLFVCSTTDNWIQYFLHTAQDIPNTLYDNPIQNNKNYNATFFIIFIVIASWLVIRLLIGVFIDQFGIISGSKLLTERQKLWRDMNRIAQSLKPKKLSKIPKNSLRQSCYKLVHTSVQFRRTMVTIILANYCLIASQSYNGHALNTLKSVEMGFVTIYWIEAIIKFIGNHFHDWYHDWWNIAEFVLVLGSTCCLYPTTGSATAEWGNMFYLFRIFRIIRFLPNLSELVHTVLVSLPSLIYVVELLVIWLIEFAMIFYQSFPYVNWGTCVNKDVNFERFLPSFIFSFQATTLDNWSCVMLELMNGPPYCIASTGYHESSCGIAQSALAYFILIVYVMSHIITNLFIAQIIDTITFGLLNEDAMVTPKHLTNYQILWAQQEYDPLCTGYIGLQKLRSFVYDLGTPLGRRHNAPAKWFRFILYEVYNFHVYNKGIPFRNLLETLVLYKVGSQGLVLSLRIEREKKLREIFRIGATIVIQSNIRRYLVQKGFVVSHPLEVVEIIKDEGEYDEDDGERLKKKIMARLKVLLITGR